MKSIAQKLETKRQQMILDQQKKEKKYIEYISAKTYDKFEEIYINTDLSQTDHVLRVKVFIGKGNSRQNIPHDFKENVNKQLLSAGFNYFLDTARYDYWDSLDSEFKERSLIFGHPPSYDNQPPSYDPSYSLITSTTNKKTRAQCLEEKRIKNIKQKCEENKKQESLFVSFIISRVYNRFKETFINNGDITNFLVVYRGLRDRTKVDDDRKSEVSYENRLYIIDCLNKKLVSNGFDYCVELIETCSKEELSCTFKKSISEKIQPPSYN